ncbi:MAG TPA: 50S ribosomal protein L25 [Polyangia bacterium]|jgi:large subunit ribosomal protein L25|nr:50S ribosomal protein L25 [Polyangia bacterium]
MEFAKVSVEVRSQVGKGGAHKVRAAGKVPGVLYGQESAPVSVAFEEKALLTSLDKEKRRNTVLTLAVADGGKTQEVTAMVREAQIDPISQRLIHVDFLRVDVDAEVRVTVPLSLVGKAVGTTNGGQLHQSLHSILIAAKPAAIPTKIEADVSALEIGDALHVSDLKLGAGVRALLAAKDAIASVVAPKAEKAEEAAAAPVEGAVPAEGAAAAPAAGGDKAAAPAAAGAKKEGEKKGK